MATSRAPTSSKSSSHHLCASLQSSMINDQLHQTQTSPSSISNAPVTKRAKECPTQSPLHPEDQSQSGDQHRGNQALSELGIPAEPPRAPRQTLHDDFDDISDDNDALVNDTDFHNYAGPLFPSSPPHVGVRDLPRSSRFSKSYLEAANGTPYLERPETRAATNRVEGWVQDQAERRLKRGSEWISVSELDDWLS